MSVSWVAGSTFAHVSSGTLNASTPAGISSGDTILAAVFARSAITAPSGWTLVEAVEWSNGSSIDQRMSVFTKTTVSSSDSSTSFAWSQSDTSQRIGVVYAVMGGVTEIAGSDSNSVVVSSPFDEPNPTWLITPASITATDPGQMLVVFASTIFAPDNGFVGVTPIPQSGFSLFSGTSRFDYRLAGAYRAVGTGESNSGVWDYNGDGNWINGLGSITVLLSAASSVEAVTGSLSAPSPLQSGQIRGRTVVGARLTTPGPLGPAGLIALHDFTSSLSDAHSYYTANLIDSDGLATQVQISSWNATLHRQSQSYMQMAVPGALDLSAAIASAVRFEVIRGARRPNGDSLETLMYSAPVGGTYLSVGPRNNSATVTGYGDAFSYSDQSNGAFFVTLKDIRAVFVGTGRNGRSMRVRCPVDWLLRPGMFAFSTASGLFRVDSISYYVAAGTDQDSFMEVAGNTD